MLNQNLVINLFNKSKILYLLISMAFCPLLRGQNAIELLKDFQSPNNRQYWKNRTPFQGYWQQDVAYKINCVVIDSSNSIIGEEEIAYCNNSEDTIKEIYFHLYQNAFTKNSYNYQLEKYNKAKITFDNPKRIDSQESFYDVQIIKNNIQSSNFKPDSLFNTIGRINLNYKGKKDYLLPHQSLTLKLKFYCYFDGGSMRRRMKMFIHDGVKHFDAVHWYPRICVYDRKMGWETDQHYNREFYGDYGQYQVNIKIPKKYILEATGILQNPDEVYQNNLREAIDIKNLNKSDSFPVLKDSIGYRNWIYKGNNIHDFAFTADPTYRVSETEWKGIKIVAIAQKQIASKWINTPDFTKKVISTYSNTFGMYDWPKIVVADARDGMEYNMLTLCGGQDPSNHSLIAHEVGHEWFYGMVGNNETYRAFLDEGFTQFLTSYAMHSIEEEPKNIGVMDLWKPNKTQPNFEYGVIKPFLKINLNTTSLGINNHSDQFNSAVGHGGGYGNVYYKGASLLVELRYILGDSLFFKAMKDYVSRWKFCHPYPEDFRNSFIQSTHLDLTPFFDQWIESNKFIDYAIIGLKSSNDGKTAIRFQRNGTLNLPVKFTVFGKDYKTQNKSYIISSSLNLFPTTESTKFNGVEVLKKPWLGFGEVEKSYSAEINPGFKVIKCVIDTSNLLIDFDGTNNQTGSPYVLRFDKLKFKPTERRYYEIYHRPDIWYNAFNGIKVGYHIEGSYLDFKDKFKFSIWYNSNQLMDKRFKTGKNNRNLIDFNIEYRTPLIKYDKSISFFSQGLNLDGYQKFVFGLDKFFSSGNKLTLDIRGVSRSINYLTNDTILQNNWVGHKWNNTINIKYKSQIIKSKFPITLELGGRISAFLSDYSYSGAYFQLNKSINNNISTFKFRFFSQFIFGKNIAPESKLYYSSSNPEQIIDNNVSRTIGIIPLEWAKFGANINHYQAAGGLNLRGYSGYFNPVNSDLTQYYNYYGNSGSSLNIEWDFNNSFDFVNKRINRFAHINPYLFYDGGIMSITTISKKELIFPYLRSDAGLGFVFSIYHSKIPKANPLNIRVDFPVYLSSTPFVSKSNFEFRYIIGINKIL